MKMMSQEIEIMYRKRQNNWLDHENNEPWHGYDWRKYGPWPEIHVSCNTFHVYAPWQKYGASHKLHAPCNTFHVHAHWEDYVTCNENYATRAKTMSRLLMYKIEVTWHSFSLCGPYFFFSLCNWLKAKVGSSRFFPHYARHFHCMGSKIPGQKSGREKKISSKNNEKMQLK